MVFYKLVFRAYCHATEDVQKVEDALRFISHTNKITHKSMKGYYGNPIIVMEGELKKSKDIRAFFSELKNNNLTAKIIDELSDRIDEGCKLYMRFDKQSAFEKIYALARHDDVISVNAKIKVYPTKKENAVKLVKEFLEDL